MKLIVLAVALLAVPAVAGEKYLGAIVSAAGADTTNVSTAVPFKVSQGSKLTLNCTAAANVCVDTSSACTALGGANPGVPVASGANFPTSTEAQSLVKSTTVGVTFDGSIVRIFGAGAVTCYVFSRAGNE